MTDPQSSTTETCSICGRSGPNRPGKLSFCLVGESVRCTHCALLFWHPSFVEAEHTTFAEGARKMPLMESLRQTLRDMWNLHMRFLELAREGEQRGVVSHAVSREARHISWELDELISKLEEEEDEKVRETALSQ